MNTEFKREELALEGVQLITPFYMEDERGYFLKSVERDVFKQWGLDADIYEAFESRSRKGVIRGLHFQTREPQVKLVRALFGTIRDVVVDLRRDSATFGQYISVILSDENHQALWIPAGFAHGFEVLSDSAVMSYQCVGKYLKGYDTGIRWDDETLDIAWETRHPLVSPKDQAAMTFAEFVQRYQGL